METLSDFESLLAAIGANAAGFSPGAGGRTMPSGPRRRTTTPEPGAVTVITPPKMASAARSRALCIHGHR